MTLSRLIPEEHQHLSDAHCPVCDQPITTQKFTEIQERIRAEEQERTAQLEEVLKAKLAGEVAELRTEAARQLASARADTVAAIAEGEQRAAKARTEAHAATEASFAPRVAEIEQGRMAAEQRATELANAREREAKERAEEQAAATAREQTIRDEKKAAVDKAERDAAAKIAAVQEEAKKTAEAAVLARVRQLEQARSAAETLAAETAAARDREAAEHTKERAAAAAREQALLRQKQEALEAAAADSAAKLAAAKEEARVVAEASMHEKLSAAESAKAALEAQLQETKTGHEANLEQRLKEMREALQKDKDDALNAERARAFEERSKVEEALQQALRRNQNLPSHELGEGAEVDLFEVLKAAFEGDKIRRVKKGTPGADIIHEIIHDGVSCGKLVYDSKNRKAWQSEFASKLRSDQIAEKADHAILSTLAFPAGTKQIHEIDGVILANPARVTVLAEILRRQTIRMHEQRVSNEQREEKMSKLYAFVTSEACLQLLGTIETLVDSVLEMDEDEVKAHKRTWEKRGRLLTKVLKAKGDLCFEISGIVGAADGEDAE